MKGKELKVVPSTLTTWKEWKRLHPDTKVLPGRRRTDFMGIYRGRKSHSIGFAVRDGKSATFYSLSTLSKHGVVNDRVGKSDLVIAFSPDSAAVLVWESGGLTFDAAGPGQMKDRETRSLWSIFSGICTDGKKKGKRLTRRAGISILVGRFRAFWPQGRIF